MHEPEAARVVLAYLRVEAVGDDHDGILFCGLRVLLYRQNLRKRGGGKACGSNDGDNGAVDVL